jgi:hypothetical protein
MEKSENGEKEGSKQNGLSVFSAFHLPNSEFKGD